MGLDVLLPVTTGKEDQDGTSRSQTLIYVEIFGLCLGGHVDLIGPGAEIQTSVRPFYFLCQSMGPRNPPLFPSTPLSGASGCSIGLIIDGWTLSKRCLCTLNVQ